MKPIIKKVRELALSERICHIRTFPARTNTEGNPSASLCAYGAMSATCGPNNMPATISPMIGEAPMALIRRPAIHIEKRKSTTCKI